jgi:ketosteroid isomerase-like protein
VSGENVEVARRMYEVLAERGMNEQAIAVLIKARVVADGAELDLRPAYPDGEVWTLEDVGSYFDSQPWGRSLRIEGESFRAVEDDRVLVFVRTHGVGGGSGLEVEGRFAHLLLLRGSRVVRVEVYTDRDKALEAAGLSE